MHPSYPGPLLWFKNDYYRNQGFFHIRHVIASRNRACTDDQSSTKFSNYARIDVHASQRYTAMPLMQRQVAHYGCEDSWLTAGFDDSLRSLQQVTVTHSSKRSCNPSRASSPCRVRSKLVEAAAQCSLQHGMQCLGHVALSLGMCSE